MQNAALAYQGTKINTATPEELTLMLYEGAIKFCNIAIVAIEKNDLSKGNTNILKAEKIILKLRETLDFTYPVAKDFDRVYDYIYNTLVQGNIKKDITIVEEALKYIREMKDTWKEVMQLNRKGV